MINPFDSYDLKKAQEVIQKRFGDGAKSIIAFYNGDHFQGGEGWIGPRRPSSDPFYSTSMKEIERGFISHNVIAEVNSRHVSGVLGRDVHWAFVPNRSIPPTTETDPDTGKTIEVPGEPTEEEKALILEAQSVLADWWSSRNVGGIIQDALAGALNIKRSPLRLYVPPGLRDESGKLPTVEPKKAIDYVWLQHLGTDEETLDQQLPSATVYVDSNTRRSVGIFTYTVDSKEFAELSYTDDAGNTLLRILSNDKEGGEPVAMQLGGRLTIYEIARQALITPQIISQQKALNMAMSMKQRNSVQGGFLERVVTNAEWPTEPGVDAEGNVVDVPVPLPMGAGFTTNLQGREVTDANGNKTILTPGVNYRDPVSPGTFIETEGSIYVSILQQAQQLHYALAGDAVVSGESRKQARDAFHKDLQFTAGIVEGAIRWVLETALAMAADFAGSPGKFEGLRAYVQAHIDSGPISAEEMTTAANMYVQGVWDWETAASATGIDDVDAVRAKIEQDQREKRLRDRALAQAALDAAQTEFDNDPANTEGDAGA